MPETFNYALQAAAEAAVQLPPHTEIEEAFTIFEPKVEIFTDVEQLFKAAGDVVAETLLSYDDTILNLPTGNTPVGLYNHIEDRRRENPADMDFSTARVRGLDEYWDIFRRYNRWDEESFRWYFDNIVYGDNRVNVPNAYRLHPNIRARDPLAEAQEFEEKLQRQGHAHLTIAGLGPNGHIAFNEPGSPRYSRSRLVTLTPETRNANKGDVNGSFNGEVKNVPFHAITQGVGNLLESERILMLVIGKGKAEILRRALEEDVSEDVPASWLRTQPKQNVTIFADAAAASGLTRSSL